MKWLAALLTGLVLILQYQLWIGDGSLAELRRLEARVDAQEQENERLHERNEALETEVVDLKQGLDAVEERARGDLGMIREDETFYRIVE